MRPAAPALETGNGIRSRNAPQHGTQGRNDSRHEGPDDGGRQAVLHEDVFPPFQAPCLGKHGRRRIRIGKGAAYSAAARRKTG